MVYDLRPPTLALGWPYGLAGASSHLFRCGRLPVFAVAGSPASAACEPRPLSEPSAGHTRERSLEYEGRPDGTERWGVKPNGSLHESALTRRLHSWA
jgi:hypothetical protein